MGPGLPAADRALLCAFVAEILPKGAVYRGRFHHDGWNGFDAVGIGIALLPTAGGLSVLRALRVVRNLRLVAAGSPVGRRPQSVAGGVVAPVRGPDG